MLICRLYECLTRLVPWTPDLVADPLKVPEASCHSGTTTAGDKCSLTVQSSDMAARIERNGTKFFTGMDLKTSITETYSRLSRYSYAINLSSCCRPIFLALQLGRTDMVHPVMRVSVRWTIFKQGLRIGNVGCRLRDVSSKTRTRQLSYSLSEVVILATQFTSRQGKRADNLETPL